MSSERFVSHGVNGWIRVWDVEPINDGLGNFYFDLRGGQFINCFKNCVADFCPGTAKTDPEIPRGTFSRAAGPISVFSGKASIRCEPPPPPQKTSEQLQCEIADMAVQYAGNGDMMPSDDFFALVREYKRASK